MSSYHPQLSWIDSQRAPMLQQLEEWANINSGSENLAGLDHMTQALSKSFAKLNGKIETIPLPPRTIINDSGKAIEIPHGQALSIVKRPDAKIKVFLGGHMDTVYPISHKFQNTSRPSPGILKGPGVADMKGGLVVMLKALEALEQTSFAKHIGWEVLINPDEEVGSLGSEHLLTRSAKRNSLGLIFEPSLPDGKIVSSRKGSANLTIFCSGVAAHAGRDFDQGRNAIVALSKFIVAAQQIGKEKKGITLNFGSIMGGGPVNVVPDHAICRLNVRTVESGDFHWIEAELNKIATSLQTDGIKLSIKVQNSREPKLFDKKNRDLFDLLKLCAKEEQIDLEHYPSGGACDGNLLSEQGLPVIDSLGVVGSHLHTPEEYMVIESLVSRTRLVALFLMKLANGEFGLPLNAQVTN